VPAVSGREQVVANMATIPRVAGIVLLFSLVASGQIRLRKVDGWPTIAEVLRQRQRSAA